MKRIPFALGFLFLSLTAAGRATAAPDFALETGVRISSALPQAVTGDTGTELRLYFVRDFQVFSATATDGLSFSEQAGVRISTPVVGSSVTSAGLLPLNGGGYRMLFSVLTAIGDYRIESATSTDGLAWAPEAGERIPVPAATFAGSVRLVEMPDGGWRAFYVRAETTGVDPSTFRIFTATSGDEGQSWSAGAKVFDEEARDVGLAPLTDGSLRLFYTAPLTGQTTATQVLSAVSGSIQNPAVLREAGVRLSTDVAEGGLSAPLPVRGAPDHTWRLYHAFTALASTVPVMMSALADEPDPRFITPSSVETTDPPAVHAITGEIFESTVTVLLRRSGEADVAGTDVVRTSDQSISAKFDVQGKAVGAWDVVVENADGNVGILAGGFKIEIPAGEISILDNVFRPALGQSAALTITIFEAGRVTVRLYTLDGRLVRTLVDGDLPSGATLIPWDGSNDDGRTVATGAYFVECKGPRLSVRRKIAVIK